jgi:carbon monoxide dehydrogenase subunit G
MKFTGELTVKAPRAAVYEKIRDARFFASCVDGVKDLAETGPDQYSAVFETKVAYMKFAFKVTVAVTRAEPPARSGLGRRHAARHRRADDRRSPR